jgi:hypothetical protein
MPQMYGPAKIQFGIPDAPKNADGSNVFEPEQGYHPYPKALYKDEPNEETGERYMTVIVANETEQTELGDGWVDTPAKFLKPDPPKKPGGKKAA